jgi:hypothetical protein
MTGFGATAAPTTSAPEPVATTTASPTSIPTPAPLPPSEKLVPSPFYLGNRFSNHIVVFFNDQLMHLFDIPIKDFEEM